MIALLAVMHAFGCVASPAQRPEKARPGTTRAPAWARPAMLAVADDAAAAAARDAEHERAMTLESFRTLQAEQWGPHHYRSDAFDETLRLAESVFVGEVASVEYGMMNLSNPPIHHAVLHFREPVELIRGAPPAGRTFGFSVCRHRAPQFPLGVPVLVALGRGSPDATPVVRAIVLAVDDGEDRRDAARSWSSLATALCGWRDNWASPWRAASFGGEWLPPNGCPYGEDRGLAVYCRTTGRPGLWAGPGVRLTVEQVPPAELRPHTNTYGDGRFRVTVTNMTDAPVTVPALVSDENGIRWADSVVVFQFRDSFNRDPREPMLLPGAGGEARRRPTVLGPGERVSAEVDLLPLVTDGGGGSRVYFMFCLGELSTGHFFYYSHDYHDAMRKGVTVEALRRARKEAKRVDNLIRATRHETGAKNEAPR